MVIVNPGGRLIREFIVGIMLQELTPQKILYPPANKLLLSAMVKFSGISKFYHFQ